MNGTGNPDRLVGGTERRIAAHFGGDGVTQATNAGDIVTLGRLGQPPIEMALALPLWRNAAGGHFQGGNTEVLDEMVPLGSNVAVINVDQNHLGLDHILGLGFTRRTDSTRNHEQCHATGRCPIRLQTKLAGEFSICGDERRVWRLVGTALFGQCTHRNPAVAIAEHHIDIGGDHCWIWLDRQLDDVLRRHDQHLSCHGQNRHSKKSRSRAMRGSSSPASVAWRMRTARSLMRWARSPSNGTNS